MGACISVLDNASKAEALQGKVTQLEQEKASLQAALAAQGGHAPPAHAPHPQQHHGGGGGGGGGNVLQVLFFPDKGMPCRNFLEGRQCRRPNCDYAHEQTSLVTLLGYLNRAQTALDICVFTITCNEIADAILAAHRRGVKVRVISDNDQATSQGSDIAALRQAGIPVRLDRDSNHMHHKFAIIDYRILVNGSFNWTRNAVLGNQENLTIMDSPQLAQQYGTQFERLWQMYG